MWCIEILDPRSPSTLKLTQFLVKEKGLKVFDSDESKEFLVQLSSSVITSSFSPNDEKILFGCSGKVLFFSGITRGIVVKIEISRFYSHGNTPSQFQNYQKIIPLSFLIRKQNQLNLFNVQFDQFSYRGIH